MQIKTTGAEKAARQMAELRAGLTAQELRDAAGQGVYLSVQDHFIQLNGTGNRLGGKRTDYWMRAAQATSLTATGDHSASVLVNHRGVALHYYGGTISPKGTSEITGRPIKFLTVPVHPLAHGQNVASLRALGYTLYAARGGLYLEGEGKHNPAVDTRVFTFTRSVTIQPNPAVLPSHDTMTAAVVEQARDWYAAKLHAMT